MKILAVIPARGGSKGLPRKNLLLLDGKPLIYYSIAAAILSEFIDRTVVSTDDDEIAEVAAKYNAEVIKRPVELADDQIMPDAAVVHSIEYLKKTENYTPDCVVFLQPTSPIRSKTDIDSMINVYHSSEVDSVFSAVDIHPFFWGKRKGILRPVNYDPNNRERRQDLEPDLIENGSVYITDTTTFLSTKGRFGKKINSYIMKSYSLFEIDTREDFDFIENLLQVLKKRGENVIS